jgi:hypothetical protein
VPQGQYIGAAEFDPRSPRHLGCGFLEHVLRYVHADNFGAVADVSLKEPTRPDRKIQDPFWVYTPIDFVEDGRFRSPADTLSTRFIALRSSPGVVSEQRIPNPNAGST